jgi:RHS repeat-associated protein
MQGSFNNLNQLSGLSGGGLIPMQGKVSKLANVAVNGKASTLNTNSAPYVFTYNLPVASGTNNVSIVALDGSGNAKTNNYQIVVPGVTATSCAYDADGNCLSDGTRSYQWDALNRLIQITQGSNTYQFAYDGQSRRVSETDNGTLTKQWVWAGSQMAEEQDGSNTVTRRFYSQGEQQAGTAYYYTSDHLGSVREVCNSSGSIVARYSYDPYGRATLVSGTNLATFQYAGYYTHQPSGLNLTLYRAYDPNTARWLARDPAGESRGIDLYDYVQNNPLARTDTLGLAWTEVSGTIKLTSLWTSTGVRYDWEKASGEGATIADAIYGEYGASAQVTCVCNGQQKIATGTRVEEKDLGMGPMLIRTSVTSGSLGNPFSGSFLGLIGKLLSALGKSTLPLTALPTADQTADIANHVKGQLPPQSDLGTGWLGGKSPCSKL